MITIKNKTNQSVQAALFLLPGFILFLTFIIGPMIYSFRISFFDWNIIFPEKSTWVGFANYLEAILDPIFRKAVLNNGVYTLVTVPGQMVFGLLVALLLNQQIRGKAAFRVIFYLPVITSWVIVSLLFEYMFSGQAGLINYLLRDVLHIIDQNILWLADPVLAFIPIHLLGIWKGVGWTAVIFLAGLQAIPVQLYEAALVDGANRLQQFRYITLPMIRQTTIYLVVVLTAGALNAYISNLLLTNGGDPLDQTHFILTLMYEETFGNLEFGYGSAISYLLTIIVFIISVIQIRLLRNREQV